jgi:hypothetical protein
MILVPFPPKNNTVARTRNVGTSFAEEINKWKKTIIKQDSRHRFWLGYLLFLLPEPMHNPANWRQFLLFIGIQHHELVFRMERVQVWARHERIRSATRILIWTGKWEENFFLASCALKSVITPKVQRGIRLDFCVWFLCPYICFMMLSDHDWNMTKFLKRYTP